MAVQMRALEGAVALLLFAALLDLILPSEALLGPSRQALGARISCVRQRLQLSRPKDTQNLLKVLTSRGGSDEEDDEDEEGFEDEEEEEEQTEGGAGQGLDDDDDDDEEPNDAGVNEGDFNDGSWVNMVKKEYLRTPPITKGYMWGTVVITALSYALNGNAWPQWLLLEWKPVFTRLQIWRPLTSFMFLGNLGLNYLLSAHFMWTYMAQLEKMKCKDPADFLIMLLFGAVSLLVASQALGFAPAYLGHNLSCYLVYIWSRMFEGHDVDVMGLFHLPAHMLPWFFVAQTVVLEKELPVSDLVGIAVGHLYHFLHSTKRLVPPAALRAVFERKEVRKLYRKFEDELQ